MGKAKQRRRLIEQLGLPERRADIARLVRSVDFVSRGGTCAMRAVTGQKVLAMLGIRARLTFGAMLYRAGPDELADTVAFCGPDNRALRLDRKVLGHYWLEAGSISASATGGSRAATPKATRCTTPWMACRCRRVAGPRRCRISGGGRASS